MKELRKYISFDSVTEMDNTIDKTLKSTASRIANELSLLNCLNIAVNL